MRAKKQNNDLGGRISLMTSLINFICCFVFLFFFGCQNNALIINEKELLEMCSSQPDMNFAPDEDVLNKKYFFDGFLTGWKLASFSLYNQVETPELSDADLNDWYNGFFQGQKKYDQKYEGGSGIEKNKIPIKQPYVFSKERLSRLKIPKDVTLPSLYKNGYLLGLKIALSQNIGVMVSLPDFVKKSHVRMWERGYRQGIKDGEKMMGRHNES